MLAKGDAPNKITRDGGASVGKNTEKFYIFRKNSKVGPSGVSSAFASMKKFSLLRYLNPRTQTSSQGQSKESDVIEIN